MRMTDGRADLAGGGGLAAEALDELGLVGGEGRGDDLEGDGVVEDLVVGQVDGAHAAAAEQALDAVAIGEDVAGAERRRRRGRGAAEGGLGAIEADRHRGGRGRGRGGRRRRGVGRRRLAAALGEQALLVDEPRQLLVELEVDATHDGLEVLDALHEHLALGAQLGDLDVAGARCQGSPARLDGHAGAALAVREDLLDDQHRRSEDRKDRDDFDHVRKLGPFVRPPRPRRNLARTGDTYSDSTVSALRPWSVACVERPAFTSRCTRPSFAGSAAP